jgi:hypothetical protein
MDRTLRSMVRWSVSDPHGNIEAAAQGRPTLFVCRHGQLWPLLWAVRPARIGIMISRSEDGELLSRVLGERDFRLLRGSTSRDASAVARSSIRELRAGHSVGLAVDGPRGPRGVVQEGVLRLAQRAPAAVVPMRVEGGGRWVLHRSWDAFEVPRPFGRLAVEVGPPIEVGPTEAELASARHAVQAELGPHLESVTEAASRKGWA